MVEMLRRFARARASRITDRNSRPICAAPGSTPKIERLAKLGTSMPATRCARRKADDLGARERVARRVPGLCIRASMYCITSATPAEDGWDEGGVT